MGWIELDRPKGTSNKDFFQERLGGDHLTIVDAAQSNSVCYMAARTPNGVIALIAQFHWVPNARRHLSECNFGYKAEDESMGPYSTRCPERILEALSPLSELYDPSTRQFESAREWRESCWKRLFEKRAKPKVKPGDVVRFSRPLKFVDGLSGDTFTFVKRSTFVLGGDTLVRIMRWRELYTYEVLEAAGAPS